MEELRPLDDKERLDWLRLIRSDHIGPVTFHHLLERFGDAGAAIEAIPELARRGGARRKVRIATTAAAEKELAALGAKGGRMAALCEPAYPRLLAHIADAPPLISILGDADRLGGRIVAIVGARNGSANGMRFAETLAHDLADAGLTVVSGLARGMDAAAHRGALAGGTVAVMAGGVDVVYPRENRALYDAILSQGALISEQSLGLAPQARHFPRRNRIVSGVAMATIVIEATLRSGSLITARLAGEQGREVFAVPGSPMDPRARGTNKLIREGAALVESADDVLEALQGLAPRDASTDPPAPSLKPQMGDTGGDFATSNELRDRVLCLLGPDPVAVDDITRESGFPPAHIAMILLELELAGRLHRHPGGQVSLAFE